MRITVLIVLFAVLPFDIDVRAEQSQWESQFPDDARMVNISTDSLTLEMAIELVRQANPAMLIGESRRRAALSAVKQADLRLNPELELETENVSGHMRGFSQSETSLLLSQELELWGQRGARKNVAMREYEVQDWLADVTEFDLFEEIRLRFHVLLHAQERLSLNQRAALLAESISESIADRVSQGAALSSELLLAELEQRRTEIELSQAQSELEEARISLAMLWNGDGENLRAVENHHRDNSKPALSELVPFLDESRDVMSLSRERNLLGAMLGLEEASGKPNLSLTGGFKRAQDEGTGSFILGLSIPLPIFDRNQGNVGSLIAQSDAIDLERDQSLKDSEANLKRMNNALEKLLSKRESLDTLLLPAAENAYRSLQKAFDVGRVPYATLLDAERELIAIQFELNDLDLEIIEGAIAIERLLGITFDNINRAKGE